MNCHFETVPRIKYVEGAFGHELEGISGWWWRGQLKHQINWPKISQEHYACPKRWQAFQNCSFSNSLRYFKTRGCKKGWNIWVVSFMMVLNYRDIALRLLRPGLSWKIFKRRLSTVLLLTKNKAKPRTAQFGIICHFGTIHDPVVY